MWSKSRNLLRRHHVYRRQLIFHNQTKQSIVTATSKLNMPHSTEEEQEEEVASWEKRMGTVNYFPDFIHAWNPDLFKQVGGVMTVAAGGSFLLFGFLNPVPYVAIGVTAIRYVALIVCPVARL